MSATLALALYSSSIDKAPGEPPLGKPGHPCNCFSGYYEGQMLISKYKSVVEFLSVN